MMLAANRHIKHTSVSHSAGWRRNVAVPGRGFAAAAAAQQKQNQKQKKKKEVSPYKDTILLPTTSFQLRGNSPVREPQIHKQWEERRIYERLAIERKDAPTFTLHDGPPYANGSLHMGHALNKVLKDFINRYHLLQGKRARYVPGWDTHGLPIELKVLQDMKPEERAKLTSIKLREKARKFALKTVDAQRDQFKRFGIWADWDAPYLTLDKAYEAGQMEVFMQMVLNGHIYRGFKPVHWSPSSKTALAEAELEYPEGHTSRSVYVAFPAVELNESLPSEVRDVANELAFVVWTTTPWTMPGNAGVAVNGDLTYAVLDCGESFSGCSSRYLVVAQDLVDELVPKLGIDAEVVRVVAAVPGSSFAGSTYAHPMYTSERGASAASAAPKGSRPVISPVVVGGDYITTESGTGLVHTAPGHGQEDYLVGMREGLPMISPVDDEGKFTADCEDGELVGLSVLKEGNEACIAKLSDAKALLLEESYAHKYPYDWRTKKPTIFRATQQWFASVEGFRPQALDAIDTVQWMPAAGEKRIRSMTEGRSDWCISRQRIWGVPIPVFYKKDNPSETLMDEESMRHIISVISERGTDAWFYLPVEDLLPPSRRGEADQWERGTDTMDVWFDSGSSWNGVLQARRKSGEMEELSYPADLYLEGSDQHRGWFQSSLLTSVASNGMAPYKAVLTHGFVLDEKGFKMSKSLGNVVDPLEVINGGKDAKKNPPYGADVLRLWVSSVDYTGDVLIGDNVIKQTSEFYRKLRGMLRFLIGNLDDFTASDAASIDVESLPGIDRYLLQRCAKFMQEAESAYESYQFSRMYSELQILVSELSSFFFDVSKDRLYIQAKGGESRRACQRALYGVLQCMLPVLAPIAPHMTEDAYAASQLAQVDGAPDSIFALGWFGEHSAWRSLLTAEEEARWASVLQLRDAANKGIEDMRNAKAVGASLESQVLIAIRGGDGVSTESAEVLRALCCDGAQGTSPDALRYVFLASQVRVVEGVDELEGLVEAGTKPVVVETEAFGEVVVGVAKAEGAKCSRCWNYSGRVGSDPNHPDLCERCAPVVVEEFGMQAAPKTPVSV
ncbi:isoleucyl-tRNA synthetase [Pycnococcus provasolii]